MPKTVLITGASRGIGRAAALRFAKAGWNVAVHYLQSAQAAQELAEKLRGEGCDAFAVCADVADRAQVEQMAAAVSRRLGPVEALVNNAGIAQQKLFTDITPEEWARMFDVTAGGAFHCIQCVLPGMLARKRGSIVNVSSIWGLTGASCEVHYSAAKAALIGLTRALAKEVGPSGVRVNCVAPGVVETDMCKGLGQETLAALCEETPLGRLGTPEDIANAIFFLADAESSFITGQVLSPNGGILI